MHVQADTEAEFRGWIDSLMHEIKRLISEKEKCFASNQKTINDEKHFNANLTSADNVSACSKRILSCLPGAMSLVPFLASSVVNVLGSISGVASK